MVLAMGSVSNRCCSEGSQGRMRYEDLAEPARYPKGTRGVSHSLRIQNMVKRMPISEIQEPAFCGTGSLFFARKARENLEISTFCGIIIERKGEVLPTII